MINVANNAIAAILDIPTSFLGTNHYANSAIKMSLHEAIQVAQAYGMPFEEEQYVDKIVKLLGTLAPEARTSMWQDVHRKRPTEIDRMNGVIAKLGKAKGIPTPCCDLITNLVHGLEGKYDM